MHKLSPKTDLDPLPLLEAGGSGGSSGLFSSSAQPASTFAELLFPAGMPFAAGNTTKMTPGLKVLMD